MPRIRCPGNHGYVLVNRGAKMAHLKPVGYGRCYEILGGQRVSVLRRYLCDTCRATWEHDVLRNLWSELA